MVFEPSTYHGTWIAKEESSMLSGFSKEKYKFYCFDWHGYEATALSQELRSLKIIMGRKSGKKNFLFRVAISFFEGGTYAASSGTYYKKAAEKVMGDFFPEVIPYVEQLVESGVVSSCPKLFKNYVDEKKSGEELFKKIGFSKPLEYYRGSVSSDERAQIRREIQQEMGITHCWSNRMLETKEAERVIELSSERRRAASNLYLTEKSRSTFCG